VSQAAYGRLRVHGFSGFYRFYGFGFYRFFGFGFYGFQVPRCAGSRFGVDP
jgi:hypothetical protein